MLQKLLDLAPQQTFLVTGGVETYEAILMQLAEQKHAVVQTKAPQLTIDEAKNIARFATEGMYEKTIGIFYYSSYSNGAAEVLLKALEEPHENVLVCIVTPYPYTFPQTLRSRMRVIPKTIGSEEGPRNKKELIQKGEALALSGEDAADRREATLSFIDELELFAQQENNLVLAEALFMAKKYLLKANLPPKQVLEFILSTAF